MIIQNLSVEQVKQRNTMRTLQIYRSEFRQVYLLNISTYRVTYYTDGLASCSKLINLEVKLWFHEKFCSAFLGTWICGTNPFFTFLVTSLAQLDMAGVNHISFFLHVFLKKNFKHENLI